MSWATLPATSSAENLGPHNERQAFVVEAEDVQNGRMQIVDIHLVLLA